MQEIFNRYINYLEAERNVSPYTVRNYTTDLLHFFNFLRAKGVSSLKEVDRHVVRDYLSHLMEKGFVKASIALAAGSPIRTTRSLAPFPQTRISLVSRSICSRFSCASSLTLSPEA